MPRERGRTGWNACLPAAGWERSDEEVVGTPALLCLPRIDTLFRNLRITNVKKIQIPTPKEAPSTKFQKCSSRNMARGLGFPI